MAKHSEMMGSLIEEMDELEKLARSFQPGSAKDGSKATAEDVRFFRERFLDWHARARQMLNEVGKQALDSHYAGGGYNIHSYISDPTGTHYGTSRLPGGYKTQSYYSWNNAFATNFQKPFDEQRLILMRVQALSRADEAAPAPPPPPPAIDTIRLHTRVRAVTSQLFKDGHYREAIFRACLALKDAVQQRSGRNNLDGAPLMQLVFSLKSPILKFDGDDDEQLGYMWLFSGLMMAVRNPRAHHLGETEDLDANETIELLALISALFRALDTSVKVD